LFLSQTWTSFTAGFQKAWNTAINWTTKRLLELWGLFDETLDVEAAKQMAAEDLSLVNAEIDRQRDAALQARDPGCGMSGTLTASTTPSSCTCWSRAPAKRAHHEEA